MTILSDAPLDAALVLRRLGVPEAAGQRLRTLGLRPGARLRLLCKTVGGGRVAQVGETRVALGAAVCRGLQVEVVAR